MEERILNFIKDNIKDNNEIHVSYEFSKIVEEFKNFKSIDKKIEQDVVGDYNFGYLKLENKDYPIFSNILYEFDEIEFKN
jgi:hypothetical protein